jgi:hypothetical protein
MQRKFGDDTSVLHTRSGWSRRAWFRGQRANTASLGVMPARVPILAPSRTNSTWPPLPSLGVTARQKRSYRSMIPASPRDDFSPAGTHHQAEVSRNAAEKDRLPKYSVLAVAFDGTNSMIATRYLAPLPPSVHRLGISKLYRPRMFACPTSRDVFRRLIQSVTPR